jgi:hypothetical protein
MVRTTKAAGLNATAWESGRLPCLRERAITQGYRADDL